MSFSQFEQGIPAKIIHERLREEEERRHLDMLMNLWRESEHVLNFLRAVPPQEIKPTREVMEKWQKRLKL